jgi:multimeric flavodoxin WrbA
MSKKCLVLTASPRKGGNSDLLADAFISGAQAAGHETHKVEAAFKNIGGCIACDTCWSTGYACTRKDDFRALEPLMESCGVLVLAAPIYWYTFPMQIKGWIDRLYAYGGAGGDRPLAFKRSYLLVCGMESDRSAYDNIMDTYNQMGNFLGFKDAGILVAGGLGAAGKVRETGFLKQAESLGRGV